MADIYLVAENNYEAEGVGYLLDRYNIDYFLLKGGAVTNDAIIILPVSSLPVLGWGRQIKKILSLKAKYPEATIVALVPEALLKISIPAKICILVSGKQKIDSLYHSIINISHLSLKERNLLVKKDFKQFTSSQNKVFKKMVLELKYGVLLKRNTVTTVELRHRKNIMDMLGFESLHQLRLVGVSAFKSLYLLKIIFTVLVLQQFT